MSTIRERVILFLKFATGTVFFLIYIGTIDSQSASHPALDNYVIGVPQVSCEENDVLLDIVTSKPFKGNIYVKGHSKDASCRQAIPASSNSSDGTSYALTLGRCGMQRLRSASPRGVNFSVTVIVSFHPAGFITKNDRAFQISCFYTEPETIVTNSLTVSHLPLVELNDDVATPRCDYSVRSGSINGPRINFANIGETVFHVWECKGAEMGILIAKCFVTDGSGEEHKVIDSNGCSLDPLLISEVDYSNNSMRAHAQSYAFKYADSNHLFFKCQIRMCQKQTELCRAVSPPNCGNTRNTKQPTKTLISNSGLNPDESVESLQSQNSQNDGSISTKQRSRNREIPENEQETTAEGWTVTQTDLKDGRKKRNPQQQPRFFEEVDVVSPQMLVLDAEERRQVALAVNSKSTNPPIQLLRNNGGSLCFEHNSLALIAVSFVLLGSLAVLFVQKMCRMLFSGIFCKENPWSFKWRF